MKGRVEQFNRSLMIATVVAALLYGGYFIFTEGFMGGNQCCDGPCWDGKSVGTYNK